MTEDHYKRLVAILLDTVTAQQQQIDTLTAALQPEPNTPQED